MSPQRVDFSGNAKVFDQRHGSVISSGILRALMEASELPFEARLLDLGAGTGRVAVALAQAGWKVVALEPSEGMRSTLREKAAGLRLPCVAGEGERVPFVSSSFDGVLLARLLCLVHDWRSLLREAMRVSKAEGALLHEWGNGSPDEAWVQIRERARRLFQEAGVAEPFHHGARSETEVEDFLNSCGWRRAAEVQFETDSVMTAGDFLGRVREGEFSYTWGVPPPILGPCLTALERWTAERFGLDHAMPFPREIEWKVYRSSA
ncbi:MAG TPA: class I SAM-dependent methyltransferase [Vicinamibacteria bacterium]